MLKKYIKIILLLLIFNLLLGGIICFLSGNRNIVSYSNTLFIMGAIYGGLGPITLLGNFRNRATRLERRMGTLIGRDSLEDDKEGIKTKENNFKYMVLLCFTGILTMVLSGFVLIFG